MAKKDLATNTLWVVQGHNNPHLLAERLTAVNPSWISGTAPSLNDSVTVKTRYRAPDGPCHIVRSEKDLLELTFPVPQWAPTPGQSAVLYSGDVCLGGGFIDTVCLQSDKGTTP